MRFRLTAASVAAALAGWVCSAGFVQQSLGSELPAGPGREVVETLCAACHPVNRISRSSGYSAAGWNELIGTMLDLSASPETRERITDYLARHFPASEAKAPTLVPGELELVLEEWVVPTLGQRPRDPIQADDGKIWWAGQWGNLVGSIEPSSGEMREYPLPAGAMPHTVTLDQAGNVWYTGNKNATLGVLERATGDITEYRMPDPNARDPHSAIFDADGILWFTLQHSNMIGRLEPASGKVDLVTLPTPGSKPYGIKIDSGGNPWVACNGSNCLVKVDPETMQLTEIELPSPETQVRRLDIAGDGSIWFVNSSLGRLGRYDPDTGVVKEWPSPSGPDSHPYAIAVVDDIVWYNESGKRPDTLVRFDPVSERFQSWPIPSGKVYAGIVRHMRSTPEGGLVLHQSGTNRILRATPR